MSFRPALSLAPVLVLALASTSALAAGPRSYVSLALTRTEDFARAGEDKAKREVTILDVAAAYTMATGVGLGAKYYNYSLSGDTGEESGTVISGLGPMVSYLHGSGFFGTGTYLFEPTKAVDAGNDVATYKDGYGYVIDAGKIFEFGAWGVALQITHAKVTYTKVKTEDDEEKLEGDWNDAATYPLIGVFVFL